MAKNKSPEVKPPDDGIPIVKPDPAMEALMQSMLSSHQDPNVVSRKMSEINPTVAQDVEDEYRKLVEPKPPEESKIVSKDLPVSKSSFGVIEYKDDADPLMVELYKFLFTFWSSGQAAYCGPLIRMKVEKFWQELRNRLEKKEV